MVNLNSRFAANVGEFITPPPPPVKYFFESRISGSWELRDSACQRRLIVHFDGS